MKEKIKLPWGKSESIDLELPDEWRVTGIFEPAFVPPLENFQDELACVLANPTGMPALRESAKGKSDIVITVDDLSRPTPTHLILPKIMSELLSAGASADGITVIAALGTHRPMTEEEMKTKMGKEWGGKLRWLNHNCSKMEDQAKLGVTSRGTKVYLNKKVAAADLIISIGTIEPHVIASFGGGSKSIIPGVAGEETIGHNHCLNLSPSNFFMTGRPPARNPMRLDLEEGASLIKKPRFIVNVVLNSGLEPVKVVAGDPVLAHREGIKTSSKMSGVKADKQADVLITTSHPLDLDLRQGMRAMANNIMGVRRGGLLMNFVRAEEGTGVLGVAGKKYPIGGKGIRMLTPLILPLVPHFKFSHMKEEDKFFMYFGLQASRRNRLLFYTPSITPETAAKMPVIDFAFTIDEMMERARCVFPGRADVVVIPSGGSTYTEWPDKAE